MKTSLNPHAPKPVFQNAGRLASRWKNMESTNEEHLLLSANMLCIRQSLPGINRDFLNSSSLAAPFFRHPALSPFW